MKGLIYFFGNCKPCADWRTAREGSKSGEFLTKDEKRRPSSCEFLEELSENSDLTGKNFVTVITWRAEAAGETPDRRALRVRFRFAALTPFAGAR
jgi:hypothetical protein